jgi:DNA-binding ferritin-like protein (Dps family)
MDPQNLSDEYVNATEAVENRLMIRGFIERHSDQILDALEEAAQKTQEQDRFLDEAIPVIDSVIHVGSSRKDYMNARRWASEERRAPEPDKWLTLLTFVYIAHKGYSERSKDFAEARAWGTIMSSVETLLKEDAAKRAGQEATTAGPSPESKNVGVSAKVNNSGRSPPQGRAQDRVSTIDDGQR